MKVRVLKSVNNGRYIARFQLEDWTDQEIAQMQKFGEPEIDVGGVINYLDGSDTNSFEIGSRFIRLRSGFPFTLSMDSTGEPYNTNTIEKTTAHVETILNRINDARTNLLGMTENFSGESVYQLPL